MIVQELELRIETQKQTLAARDESIKKLMEAMSNKGLTGKMYEEERIEMERLKTRNIELETRMRHLETMLESKEKEILKVTREERIIFHYSFLFLFLLYFFLIRIIFIFIIIFSLSIVTCSLLKTSEIIPL